MGVTTKEINIDEVKSLIKSNKVELPVISTGRVFSEAKLWLTHPEKKIRDTAIQRIKDMVKLAYKFKADVNIGRVRGAIPENEERKKIEERFFSVIGECADFTAKYETNLLLEPVNRYETNFINSVEEAIEIVDKINRKNVKLMPDVYHMNIEDASIIDSLRKAKHRVAYVHFADSNRQAPGQGHIDFQEIAFVLKNIDYEGYITAEILPVPNSETAARLAIEFYQSLLADYNEEQH